ncbi:GGDEF domain-containing protein [Spirochaeta isovalerica]|uniref:diguanylate cyclase n=1 Tax=Spirochaeta isovalerica TaxID=150 RepID=A0A841R8T8_9SPIO|nr:diguanylate cyclase [Spirochaeta isovalerica]MBB6480313.1 diguanylate cyclase (GGDEF)-like protein [Spirochaeta isovalerica]
MFSTGKGMSLRFRFSIITFLLLIAASVLTYALVAKIVSSVVDSWGRRVVEIQVLNDSARILQPLEREIGIAQEMAGNTAIQSLARHPEDSGLFEPALSEMENYRQKFQSHSYFVALNRNGSYYHNNAENEYSGSELRYYLNPENEADIWFYRLIEEGLDFHLNVNPDAELGITNLWIDILMRDIAGDIGDEILGVVGTGIPLEVFLSEVVNVHQAGVTTLFVDRYGAIQLYRDPEMIDYASFVKPEQDKHTIDLLLTDPGECAQAYAIMEKLLEADDLQKIETLKAVIGGEQILAGIAYLPTIGWYEISLLNIGEIMPVSRFIPAIIIFILILIGVLIILSLFLRIEIFKPIGALEKATRRLGKDSHEELDLPSGKGEIDALIKSFASMADAIRFYTDDLEKQVEARTAELKDLMLTDPLTGLLNRRGMTERLKGQNERSARTKETFGLIWIDIDYFKEVNDSFGHAMGDTVLTAVSSIFIESIRPYDHASRWGGDEFLILLSPETPDDLRRIIDRLLSSIRSWSSPDAPSLTISIGATTSDGGESIDEVLQRADEALYSAKNSGRNRAVIAD